MVNYWVVNQSKTYRDEVEGGFLWAPVTNKIGSKQVYYTNLTRVNRGDIIFSLVKGRIVAIGTCQKEYVECKNPLVHHRNDWIEDGWKIEMRFIELDTPVIIKAHLDQILPILPKKDPFICSNGCARQGGYLHAIPEEMAHLLKNIVGHEYQVVTVNEDAIEEGIRGRTDIATTEIQRLVKSRCGQGQYRVNVFENEKSCRITGVNDPRFLIASHIKPWAKCSDQEKLDGCNGLMLTPNVDKLFDRGYISFEDNGNLIVSSKIDSSILSRLGVDPAKNVGKFTSAQCVYLRYHRDNVFVT